MSLPKALLLLCCFLVWNQDLVEASFKERDKILYKDLGTLYFSPGEKTRARRTYSVPQLQCLSGCNYPQPRLVQCTNSGWDGQSNKWICKSELDSAYALDKVEIVCEGYSSPDDPYVTVGSCSLEYSIKKRIKHDSGSGFNVVIFLLFCLFLIFVLYKTCLRSGEEHIPQNSFTNDNGPDDGQGPQMGWNIPGMNRRHTPGGAPGFGFSPSADSCGGNRGNMNAGGGGGFWTGLAAGGALGYLFGGNNNRQQYMHRPHSQAGWGSGFTSPGESSDFGWGSSGSTTRSAGESSTSESVSTARYRQR